MARPTLITGSLWSSNLANASIRPFVSDQDLPGAFEPLPDAGLSSVPGNIKGNFYGWFNRIKIGIGAGLNLLYSGYSVMLLDGSIRDVAAGSVFALPNATSFVFLDQAGSVTVGLALPNTGVPLARVTANGTEIQTAIDLRYQNVEQIAPISLPAVASPWRPGDIKPTFATTPEPGWLFCQGQTLSILEYPALNAALGFAQRNALTFTLPDLRGRTLIGASGAYLLGSVGGAARVTLTPSEMPSHSHAVNDPGHAHAVLDPGHGHPVSDPGHSHSLAPYKRSTNLPPTGTPGAELSAADKVIGNVPNTAAVQAGISVAAAPSNVAVYANSANIQIAANGGGASHENLPPYIAVNWQIKF